MFLIEYLLISLFVFFFIRFTTKIFIKKNWLDKSDNRKMHLGSIPLNGGIGMFFGFFIGIVLLNGSFDNYLVLLLCSFLILSLGFIDDISNLSAHSRILAQTLVILIAFSVGLIQITSFGYIFGSNFLSLQNWSLLITLLAFMAGMNAQNLVDGIDGLSSGTALISFTSIFYFSIISSNIEVSNLALLYISILVPFIYLNLSKNKIFMGDSGALFIGFGISWLLISSSQGDAAFIKPVTTLWIFAIPLIDISSVIVIRIAAGHSPFQPDHNHIHNQLISRFKISKKNTLFIILSLSFFLAITGIILQNMSVPDWIMFALILGIFLLYLFFIFIFEKFTFFQAN